mmetsp:Transcript_11177/g.15729  ORF Transcript_11177/g.15729 Transcript_11177/m.15729 type:complete len:200 (+) Transcript_11177:468-1067(+)
MYGDPRIPKACCRLLEHLMRILLHRVMIRLRWVLFPTNTRMVGRGNRRLYTAKITHHEDQFLLTRTRRRLRLVLQLPNFFLKIVRISIHLAETMSVILVLKPHLRNLCHHPHPRMPMRTRLTSYVGLMKYPSKAILEIQKLSLRMVWNTSAIVMTLCLMSLNMIERLTFKIWTKVLQILTQNMRQKWMLVKVMSKLQMA